MPSLPSSPDVRRAELDRQREHRLLLMPTVPSSSSSELPSGTSSSVRFCFIASRLSWLLSSVLSTLRASPLLYLLISVLVSDAGQQTWPMSLFVNKVLFKQFMLICLHIISGCIYTTVANLTWDRDHRVCKT